MSVQHAPEPTAESGVGRRSTLAAKLRFYSFVDEATGCWNWRGGVAGNGYGSVRVPHGPQMGAHRAAWIVANGPVPDGLQIDHLCRNPLCINPAHLEAVSPRENTIRGDAPSARHLRQTHCVNGHPFDEVNTRIDRRGRTCRACHRERTAKARAIAPLAPVDDEHGLNQNDGAK